MSIFDQIKDAIFGHAAQAAPASASPAQSASSSPVSPSVQAGTEPAASVAGAEEKTATAAPATSGAAPAAPSAPSSPASKPASNTQVDVAPILDAAVKKNGHKLDWRHSIVDLMKALGMEASLSERKELADELGYTGDHNDSAKMNMWLHKALMKKLSENGGKVPAELLD